MIDYRKPLEECTKKELAERYVFYNSTISSLQLELNSSSPTRARDAAMRLLTWEQYRFELDNFLNK